ncbi:hypothetical protein D3C78_1135460 [compost metagenome]
MGKRHAVHRLHRRQDQVHFRDDRELRADHAATGERGGGGDRRLPGAGRRAVHGRHHCRFHDCRTLPGTAGPGGWADDAIPQCAHLAELHRQLHEDAGRACARQRIRCAAGPARGHRVSPGGVHLSRQPAGRVVASEFHHAGGRAGRHHRAHRLGQEHAGKAGAGPVPAHGRRHPDRRRGRPADRPHRPAPRHRPCAAGSVAVLRQPQAQPVDRRAPCERSRHAERGAHCRRG